MIRNVAILALNDLAISLKNKTFFLILFIPLFVFVALQLLDDYESNVQKINIGLLEQGDYSPAMLQSLQAATSIFDTFWLPSEAAGRQWLKERQGDGFLVPHGPTTEGSTLIVLSSASLQTAAIVANLNELQRALEGSNTDWVTGIRPLQESGMQIQMLPTWILMLVLLVAFIVLPPQVAEEKEKKLLLGLLQTPIRESEWLLGKLSFGIVIILMAALFLQLLTAVQLEPVGTMSYVAFLLVGGFSFTALGILIGFLCRTQASARTLGVIIYLPLLLPSALADFSKSLNTFAPLLPSYKFYQPIKSIFLEGGTAADFLPELFALAVLGLIASFLSLALMKRRWLME